MNIPNTIPVSGTFRNGLSIFPQVGGGSIVSSSSNSSGLLGGFLSGFGFKRDDASPTIQAREPAFSLNIPNTIPVSGQFRNGISVFPQVGGGSIVQGSSNSSIFSQFGLGGGLLPFKRDDSTPTLQAREPAFSLNIPNTIPVSGTFRNGISVFPQLGGGSIVSSGSNSTGLAGLLSGFGFKRDDATPTLQAREPAFSLNIPNTIPVSGSFRNGISVFPQVGGGSIVQGSSNSSIFSQFGLGGGSFPFGLKREE